MLPFKLGALPLRLPEILGPFTLPPNPNLGILKLGPLRSGPERLPFRLGRLPLRLPLTFRSTSTSTSIFGPLMSTSGPLRSGPERSRSTLGPFIFPPKPNFGILGPLKLPLGFLTFISGAEILPLKLGALPLRLPLILTSKSSSGPDKSASILGPFTLPPNPNLGILKLGPLMSGPEMLPFRLGALPLRLPLILTSMSSSGPDKSASILGPFTLPPNPNLGILKLGPLMSGPERLPLRLGQLTDPLRLGAFTSTSISGPDKSASILGPFTLPPNPNLGILKLGPLISGPERLPERLGTLPLRLPLILRSTSGPLRSGPERSTSILGPLMSTSGPDKSASILAFPPNPNLGILGPLKLILFLGFLTLTSISTSGPLMLPEISASIFGTLMSRSTSGAEA